MAPELIKNQQYDDKIDVWSTVIVIYVLLVGEFPFCGQDLSEIAKHMEEKEVSWMLYEQNGVWSHISQ